MKIYEVISSFDNPDDSDDDVRYTEFASSNDAASKIRTRLKKLNHTDIKINEIDVPTTRTELILFLNKRMAHESWRLVIIEKLGG